MSDVLHLSVLTTRTDKRYLVKNSNEITYCRGFNETIESSDDNITLPEQ